MYTYTGFVNNEERDLEDLNIPIKVNSCGIYRLISKSSMSTVRPVGREDYQLLYIASGKVTFMIQGEELEIAEGNMVVYYPYQYQKYTYRLEDKPEVYWVHFTGYEAEEWLERAGFAPTGFQTQQVLYGGISTEYKELFLSMIKELQVARICYGEMIVLYLKQILLLIKRRQAEGIKGTSRIQEEIEQAVRYFHENFRETIEIEEYAASKHMSVCWFIRKFKQYMGMPPMQYLTSIRVNRAKELLEGTDYTISEISDIIGYDNPLYFSRVFKKSTGISPREYRKNS